MSRLDLVASRGHKGRHDQWALDLPQDAVADGNATVTINGRTRHVISYLEDFLFEPTRARTPIRALSGGERNRLLLARLFTRPANVLVLDEPTNDLDLETLELLEAQLVEWSGTLLLVSHDRVFLDNVITSTFVFEGDGVVQEYVGGYEDWVRQRADAGPVVAGPVVGPTFRSGESPVVGPTFSSGESPVVGPTFRSGVSGASKKLSYREQRELHELPARIEALETEQRTLTHTVAGPDFYKEPAATIAATLERLREIEGELSGLYSRWDALDSRPK